MLDAIIVGGGISGLRCAIEFARQGVSYKLCESNDHFGGRCSSQYFDGFVLDRGFQVLLDSYTEVTSLIELDSLNFKTFMSGAMVHTSRGNRFLLDPSKDKRKLWAFWKMLTSDVGTFRDKWRLFRLKMQKGLERTQRTESASVADYLAGSFTSRFISEFMSPFWESVFLADLQSVPATHFFELFPFFASGSGGLPENGMQAIPDSMVDLLDKNQLVLNKAAKQITENAVEFEDGELIAAKNVVLAVPYSKAQDLLAADDKNHHGRKASCIYYEAPEPPFELPILFLTGCDQKFVRTVSIPTNLHAGYSSNGNALICVGLAPGLDANQAEIRAETKNVLRELFSAVVDDWQVITHMQIPDALPPIDCKPLFPTDSISVCGDYLSVPSINNALGSGRATALRVIETL